jgi:hypothetical protein
VVVVVIVVLKFSTCLTDGLTYSAKSEASLLLAIKQAAFIRNPDYKCDGSGPDIVSVGHNPFAPNLGVSNHIVLHDGGHYQVTAQSVNNLSVRGTEKEVLSIQPWNRRKFVGEYLYDRLFLAKKPFTVSILRSLRQSMESGAWMVRNRSVNNPLAMRRRRHTVTLPDEPLPYGVHYIDPAILTKSNCVESTVFADFISNNWEMLKKNVHKESGNTIVKSDDPNVRLAFSSKLDSQTRHIQDLQVHVQQFYECRVAALERYIAFCVMFHAMAAKCSKPWFLTPWDMARSQSNLRVATTGGCFLFCYIVISLPVPDVLSGALVVMNIAAPIGVSGDGYETSQETKKLAHDLALVLRKVKANF